MLLLATEEGRAGQFTVGTWFWWRLNSLALRRKLAMLLAMLTPGVGVLGALEPYEGIVLLEEAEEMGRRRQA